MKQINLIAIMGIAVSSFFYSCSTERELENETSVNLEKLQSRPDSEVCDIFNNAAESSVIPGIKAVYIDNGITTTCSNNILIFPTLQVYDNVIIILDHQIDIYNDHFDQLTVNMTDTEADDYADQVGFYEDQPLLDFENDLSFCSLRQNIETLEDDWLSQQGDGAWNLDTNPDSHYIDDETERTLLSVGSEFIVGDCKEGYTLYKVFDWGTAEISITDINTLSNILTAINNIGSNTTMTQVSDILAASDTPHKIDVGPVYNNLPTFPNDCKEAAKEKGEKIFSSDRRIIWKNKFLRLSGFGSSPFVRGKALTKSFKKKKGKWKKYRATINAGLDGNIVSGCGSSEVSMISMEQKRRKRLKNKKELADPGNNQLHKLKPNKLVSIHKQEGSYFQDEVY